MARVRDYAAEYRRRIALGEARGVTRSEARGHRSFADAIRAVKAAKVTDVITCVQTNDPKTGRLVKTTLYVGMRSFPLRYREPGNAKAARRAWSRYLGNLKKLGKAISNADAPYVYGTPQLLTNYIAGSAGGLDKEEAS